MFPAVAVRQFLPRYARIIDSGAPRPPRNSRRHRPPPPEATDMAATNFNGRPHAGEPSRSQTTHLYSWGNGYSSGNGTALGSRPKPQAHHDSRRNT
jgi:hypothetical protein